MLGSARRWMVMIFMLAIVSPLYSQESEPSLEDKAQRTVDSARDTIDSARETVEAAAGAVDENEQAQQASAGILQPIYSLAEAFSFPAFHWLAFAIMVGGVVSFALQLTLGKLIVLAKFGFSIPEILSDVLGLSVSVVGLVLTTQAAAENSSFTSSALAVLSATVLGVVVGFIFYLWGQRQELQAVEGRKKQAAEAANDE